LKNKKFYTQPCKKQSMTSISKTKQEEEARIDKWTEWLISDLKMKGVQGINDENQKIIRNIIRISYNSGAVERNKHEIEKIRNNKRLE